MKETERTWDTNDWTNMVPFFANEHGFLSNFWPSVIRLEGIKYPTAEHAYQAMKTTSETRRKAIADMDTPGKAKRYGQGVDLIPNWDSLKRAYMTQVLYAKFLQNQELIPQLLDTKDKILVEGNWWGDNYWGATDYERTTDGILRGANWLGRILMEIREKFSEDSK